MKRYRHYKGTIYVTVSGDDIYDAAEHTETGEKLVIYTVSNTSEMKLWARPYDMFHGYTESGVKRFTEIPEEAEAHERTRTHPTSHPSITRTQA